MIKGIIEKIIMNTFGKFIKGIEKEKLSVDLFSGNFKLENISLNHEFFNSLNSPITLAYSSIGKLNLQASLSKLSSVPVECILDNIFVICQFRQSESKNWDSPQARKDKILKQVNEVFQSTLKKIKEEKKEDGMMSRLGKKIIDNLQLKIMNVHVRFEEEGKYDSYAWGLTLQEINLTTTDKNWKPCFVERTNETNEKLFKMLQVKKLNFYWKSGSGQKVVLLKGKQFSQETRNQRMGQMIKEEKQVVLSITSEFKLTINPEKDLQLPLYQLNVNLEPIKFQLQRLQLQQMMDFARKNVMQNEMIVKSISKKSKVKIGQQQKSYLKEQYEEFITAAIQNEQASHYQIDSEKLQQIFSKVEESELKLWALGPIKRKIKNIRQTQMKKKKSGWFSRGDNQLTQQEQEQLQKYIEQSFETQSQLREAKCLLFRVKVEVKGGRMLLIEHKGEVIEEQIEFNVGKITTTISKSEDKSYFDSFIEIASINLNLFVPIQKNNQNKRRKMQIFTSLRPQDYKQESDEDSMESFDSAEDEQKESFLKLNYRNELLSEATILKRTIDGYMERVTVIYKKIYMQKFRKFFTFKKGATFVKTSGSIQPTQEQQSNENQENSSKLEKVTDIKLNINSPVLICPLNQSQCWCLSLGNMVINSNRNPQFQEYPIKITSAFLRYYPFMKECFDLNKKFIKKGVFSLINDMNFQLNYQKFKQRNEEIINIQLPSFKVNFTQKQYENLMSLEKIFRVQESQKKAMVEILREERKNVEENKSYEGLILKKHETLMSWKDYYGIISGQYLYLYNDKKELKQNSRVSLKNSKIIIKQAGVEGDHDNLQIEITNQNQICYFGCHTADEILKWKNELDKKSREFKTIHELIKENELIEYNSNKKRSNSQAASEAQSTKKRKILKLTISEVEFRYQSESQECLLEFQIVDINFSRENMHQWSEKQFYMKSMIITDRIFKFKNETYQTLIEAKGVKYQELKGRKKYQETRKAIINLNVQDIYINWKPDVLLILMNLMSRHFKSEQKHRVDDDIEQSRQQHFKQVYADSKFMYLKQNYNQKAKGIFVKQKRDMHTLKSKWMKQTMKLSLVFSRLQINMIHRQTHLVMLKLLSNEITCELCNCETAKFLKGTINELDLFDMTGYPQKQYSVFEDYPPYRILTKLKSNCKPLVQFRWSSYEANSFPNQEKIDSFIWVEIEPVRYEYYQQVTLRMVDYILIQVILLLTQPEMLTVNENLLEQLKKEQKIEGQKPVKILFSKYEQIIKKIVHPFFMDMWFKVNDLNLILKAEKNSHIYYNVAIKDLIFYNNTKNNSARFASENRKLLKDFIYEDEYIVKGNDCHFIEIVEKKQKEEQVFEPFTIELNLNKLILEDEINLLFPEISKYDRSFLTINKISSIVISHYSRLQYLNINKLVNFNFTFDDQNDEQFIHNFKITKLLSPKPIFYEVVIPQIHMTADYNAKQSSEDIWKLFKASIFNFQMIYRRTKQLDSNMTFNLGITEIKGFQYLQNLNQPIQHDLMTLTGQQFDKGSTEIIIQNKTSGQKLIQMNVGEMKVNVRTGLLQLIFEYTLLEDWVFPTINKYVTELVFYATVQKMSADLCEDPTIIAAELQKKKASKKLINQILSYKFDFAKFSLEGLLCYKFQRRRNDTTQQYEAKLERKELCFEDFQTMNDVASMNVILNIEIYRSWVKSAAKRKIIQKFTYTMEDKRHLRVADINNCTIKTIAKRTMNIDRGFLKISFKDIIIMQKILQQIGEERKYINYLNEKTGKMQEANRNLVKQTQSSSLQNLELKIDSLSFYLINSRRDIFIPILKLNINNISLTKANTFKKDILKGEFSIAIYYFNNKIFRWQPILQKVNLGFHKLTYYQQNNSVFGSFDTIEPIMINLSREVLISLTETAASWKKETEEEEKKYFFEHKEIQPLEFISHYIIRNQTGYPVEVVNEKGNLIKKIPHCEQIDYQLQIQDWDQKQNEIFIGCRILHPKYQFKTIKNISFNSEKQYSLHPYLIGGPNSIINDHSKIIISLQIKQSKKILMIKSSKYVYNYFDGFCQIKALPFDHDTVYKLPKEIHHERKVSLYDQSSSEHYRYLGNKGILKIMKKYLVYNYSPIPLFICGDVVKPNDYKGISEKLKVQNIDYKDSILKIIKNEKQKQYYIFAECFVIDYYGLNFQFQKDSKAILKMYSHKFDRNQTTYNIYILPDPQFKFKVKLREGGNLSSASLKTTIGKTNFTLETKKSQCMFTANSYLHPLQNSHINQFTRIIEITPQFMLSNATKLLTKICQAESCESITLNPYQRIPFFWENKQKPKRIKISAYDGVDFWGYSGTLTIQKSTQTIVLRKSADPTMYRVFSIQLQITSTTTFIHIMEPTPKYVISNNIPGTTLQVYQAAILDEKLDFEYSFPKEFVFNVRFKQQKPFGYELPLQSHRLQIKVDLDQSNQQFKGLVCEKIYFEDVEANLQSKKINIKNERDKSVVGYFTITLCFENNIKKLKLVSQIEQQQAENTYEFIVKIPTFGLSFIGFYNNVRKQLVHIILNSIEVTFSGNADYTDINLLISRCRIQNQLKYNAIFPVLFESTHTKEAKYFMNFKISKSAKNSRLIYYIGCSINRSWLTITSQQLQAIQENLNQINLNSSKLNQIRDCEMFNSSMPDPQQSIYFIEAVIHPLKSNITFKHVNQWGGKLLKTFSSINQCPISAEGQKLKHFSCRNFQVFIDLILKHYQDGLTKMILPMIGNLTILGSPVTLVQKIGSGFKDLVELSAEGFEINPLQGGKGVVRGSRSLIANTLSGAFNTVQSITGSIGNGITLLVDDHVSFAQDRQRIKNDRSEHVVGGIANGAKSIFNGFKNGVTGLFTEPVRGAQKRGLPGFLLGTAKGIGGLVLKPISGVVDAASKTAEGIKNTPQYLSKQKQNRYIREHNPRPFYNYYKQYRDYDKFFADIMKVIEEQDEQKYSNLSWCGYYSLLHEKKEKRSKSTPILFVSYEFLFIYDLAKIKFLQILRCEHLKEVLLREDKQQTFLKLLMWDKKSNRDGYITIIPDGGCRKLASELNIIIRHFSPNITFD